MKSTFKFALLGGIILLIVAGVLIALAWWQASQPTELLVMWGTRNQDCVLNVIDPQRNEVLTTTAEEPDCLYQISKTPDGAILHHLQREPMRLTLYDLASNGELGVTREVSFDDMRATRFISVSSANEAFLAGIVNGSEQIFRVDLVSGEREQITDLPGRAFEPIISPDGVLVAFAHDPYAPNWNEYEGIVECCGRQTYRILNLTNGEEIALAKLAEYSENPQCDLQWSPGGDYIVFESGCDPNLYRQLIVVDATSGERIDLVQPIRDYTGIVHVWEWIDETHFTYVTADSFPSGDVEGHYFYWRTFVYDVATHTSREVPFLSQLGIPAARYSIQGLDWLDGTYHLAGHVIDVDENNEFVNTYILRMETGPDSDRQIELIPVTDAPEAIYAIGPHSSHWSLTGQWIVYHTGAALGVLAADGEPQVLMNTSEYSEIAYGWVSVR